MLNQDTAPLPDQQQLDFALQLVRGLKYMHSKKVAHKDFKSLNVLLDGRWLTAKPSTLNPQP